MPENQHDIFARYQRGLTRRPVMTEVTKGNSFSLDALLPPEMAVKAENIGVKKVRLSFTQKMLLSILAGAFIAFAGDFYTVISVGTSDAVGFGLSKFIGGLAFSLGLVLVIIGGAELFTGNNLKVMALASGKLTLWEVLWNWTLVYIGNLIGSLITVYGLYLTRQYEMADGAVAVLALKIANGKCALPFSTALFRGIYCNVFVCLAIWLCFSARTNTDKILCIIFPITAFVAAGFEHSVANMFFIPMGMVLKSNAGLLSRLDVLASDFSALNLAGCAKNLAAVTIGNIIGGGLLVGAVYWLIYRSKHAFENRD